MHTDSVYTLPSVHIAPVYTLSHGTLPQGAHFLSFHTVIDNLNQLELVILPT